jgi:hypothetical protein
LAQSPIETGNDAISSVKAAIRSANGENLETPDVVKATRLIYYVRGFLESTNIQQKLLPNSPIKLPQNVTVLQIVKTLDAYLEKHPEQLKFKTSEILFNALFEVYRNPDWKQVN